MEQDEYTATCESSLSYMDAKEKEIVRLNTIIKNYDEKTERNTADLRSNLAKTK